MVKFKQKGDFSKVTKYMLDSKDKLSRADLDQFGREGILALKTATPVDTGLTASSWNYEIKREKGKVSIIFNNSNIQNGIPIAIILQYGHGTRNGGYVQGRDYINPAVQPVFDRLAEYAWKEVTNV